MGFIDPHRTTVKTPETSPAGIKKKLTEVFKDPVHASFFHGLFECDKDSSYYDATLFRFPLRQEGNKSLMSPNVHSLKDIKCTHFESLKCEASFLLLFLNNVKKVSLYEMNENGPKVLFSVSTNLENDCAKFYQDSLQQEVLKYFVHLNCTTVFTRDILAGKSESFNWLVLNVIGSDDKEVNDLSKELSTIPWVGLAAQIPSPVDVDISCECSYHHLVDCMLKLLSGHYKSITLPLKENIRADVQNGGLAFCFLPLPVHTALPVHLHGYFCVSDNRRSIKWPSHDEQGHDAQWNKALIHKLIAPAYATLLSSKCALSCLSPATQEVSSAYSSWPSYSEIKNHQISVELLEPMLSCMKNSRVLWTSANEGEWVSFTQAYFVPDGCPLVVVNTLLKANLPIVLLPDGVRATIAQHKSLKELLQSRAVSSHLLRKHFPVDVKIPHREDVHSLLEYALFDLDQNNCHELFNIPLLPLQNGSCSKFTGPSSSNAVYLLPASLKRYYPDILPGIEHILVDSSLPHSLEKRVKKIAGFTQIKLADSGKSIFFIFKSSVSTWLSKDRKWSPGTAGHPPRQWLEKVWKCIREEETMLQSLVGLPFIPQRSFDSSYINLLDIEIAKPTRFCCLQASDSKVCCMFKKLNIIVVEDAITNRVFPTLNQEFALDRLSLLTASQLKSVIDSLNEQEKELLCHFFCQNYNYNFRKYKTCLKSLAIFPAISSSTELAHVALDAAFLPPRNVRWPQELSCPKGMLYNGDKRVTDFIELLEVKPVRFCEFCVDKLIPLVKDLICSPKICSQGDAIVLWVLGQISLMPPKDAIETIRFLSGCAVIKTAETGKYCKAQDLYNSEDSEFAVLVNNVGHVTPHEHYRPHLHSLKKLGLICWSDIKSDSAKLKNILFDSMKSISSMESPDSIKERGQFILDHVFNKKGQFFGIFSRNYFSKDELSRYEFLIPQERPATYPSSLQWFASQKRLYPITSLYPCNAETINLVGAVRPIISDYYQVKSAGSGYFRSFTKEDLIGQLQCIEGLQIKASGDVNQIDDMVHSIYKHLSKQSNVQLKKVWCPFLSPPRFMECHKLVFSTPFPLEPYVYQLAPNYQQFRNLWDIKSTIQISMALSTLYELNSSCATSLNETELEMSANLVQWLYREKAPPDCDILFPTVEHQLKSARDCVYDDREWSGSNSFASTLQGNLKHVVDSERIAPAIARYFRVQRLSFAVTPSSSLPIEYTRSGQYESITKRIAGIVNDYNDNIDIFKELIQNADDAGATEIKFLLDWRQHPDSSLFFEKMKPWQGPALLAYNNSVFSDQDVANICKVAGETKLRDPTKTGRFGLGFCATYQMTDVPSFVTGKLLVVFDPHTVYLGDRIDSTNPGMKIDLVHNRANLKCCEDQLVPYDGMFGCEIFNLTGNGYNGTLFRFPFRNVTTSVQSQISKKIYDQKEVTSLVQSLRKNSHNLILFQKSLCQITLHEIRQGSDMAELFSVKRDCIDVKSRVKLLSEASGSINIYKNCSTTCAIHSSQSGNFSQSSWMLCSLLHRSSESSKLLQNSGANGVLPFGEIALQVSGEGISKHSESVKGRIFCFLPLPIYNGLKFHVNGHFHVSKDRRNLSLADDRSFGTEWNTFLSQHVHSHCFIEVLKAYIDEAHVNMRTCKDEERRKFLQSYYQLWEFSVDFPTSIAPRIINGIKRLLQTTNYKLLWSECGSGAWLAVDEVILFLGVVRDQEVLNDICSILLDFGFKLIQVPHHVTNLIKEKVVSLNHVYDYKRFISEVLFPEIHHAKFQQAWIHNLCYILEAYYTHESEFSWAEQLLKSKACIPCQQSSILMKIGDVIDCTRRELAGIYEISEGRFPIQELLKSPKVKSSLIHLGMSSHSLTLEQLVDRAQSVGSLVPLEAALDRSRKLIQYIQSTYSFRVDLNVLSNIRFLPILKKPDQVELPWFGEKSDFCSPSEAYRESEAHLVFSVAKVTSAGRNLPFSLRRKPSPQLVTQHLGKLVSASRGQGNQKTKNYLDEVMTELYSYLNGYEDVKAVVKALTSVKFPVWQDGVFKPACKVVWHCTISCHPYITAVSEKYHKFEKLFLQFLKVKMELTLEAMICILKEVYADFSSSSPLPDKILTFVIQLASKIADKAPQGIRADLFLPDTHYIMRPVHQLACDNFESEWVKSLPSYQEHFESGSGYFVHPNIPRGKAIHLGVRPLFDAVVQEIEDNTFLDGYDYGQCESLCVRLNSILKKYPADASILQEFIQNADDAEASEIVFVLDHRTNHPDKTLLCNNEEWSSLQHTPALCIINNRPFTEKDIKGISDLGRGAKHGAMEKIGKFGIGFNVAYHVTDCPSFLSCGENGVPENLCVFDPTQSYIHKKNKTLPGRRWKLNPKHISDFQDQFQPYLLQDVIMECDSKVLTSAHKTGYAVFRLPLTRKSQENSKLCNGEKFTPSDIKQMFDLFQKSSKEVLLFLNNIKSVSAIEILANGQCTHCFTTSSVIPAAYSSECVQFLKHSTHCTAQLKAKTLSKSQPLFLFHELDIVQQVGASDKLSESWLVQKLVCGNFKCDELQEAFHRHNLRSVGGVAARTTKLAHERYRLFCSLPTPLVTPLPVHVNGHFVVDDSRKHLETLQLFGDKHSDWNFLLVKNVIIPAYIELIKNAKSYYINHPQLNLTVDKHLYHLFPHVNSKQSESLFLPVQEVGKRNLNDFMAKEFYGQMSYCDSELMLIKRKPTLWVPIRKAIFALLTFQSGNKLISVPRELIPILLSLNMDIVECRHIYLGFKETRFYCQFLHQDLVFSHLRSIDIQNQDVQCIIKENMAILIGFCIQEQKKNRVANSVPFLLYADGSLQKCAKAFPYSFSNLLPNCLNKIVDENLGSSSTGYRLQECGVISPPTLECIAQNIDIQNCSKPLKLNSKSMKLVSLLWSHIINSITYCPKDLQGAFMSKPILPTADGMMYPVCLSKSLIGNADEPVCDLLLKLGYSRIDFKIVEIAVSDRSNFFVETLTFSKSSDFVSCFRLGPPPNCDLKFSDDEVKLLVRSLCADVKNLNSISLVLLKLKIYRHADDTKYVSLEGSKLVYIIPPNMPKYGLGLVQPSSTTFLKEPESTVEVLYKAVIPHYLRIDVKMMYLSYILPNLSKMADSHILIHIDFIWSSSCVDNSEWIQVLDKLRETPFVKCKGKLVLVKELYDPMKMFFKEFRKNQLPDKEWWTRDRLSLLHRLGLQTSVTTVEWLYQAKQFTSQCDIFSSAEVLSTILIDELCHVIGKDKDFPCEDFLNEVSQIAFLYSPSNVVYNVRFKNVLKSEISSETLVKFSDSVAYEDGSLAFNLYSILPDKCTQIIRNPKIRRALGVQCPVRTETVIEHLKYLCEASSSYFSLPSSDNTQHKAYFKDIIYSHYKFLNGVKLKPEDITLLKEMACFLVKTEGGVNKMVKADQLIELLPSECNLEPYIYRIPAQIAQWTTLTAALGVKKEVMGEDCGRVLNNIHNGYGVSLSGESFKVAECAYHELVKCFRQRKQAKYNGYLLSKEHELVPAKDLLHNNVPWFADRVKECKFKYILPPVADHLGSRDPPPNLNVRMLSEVVRERIQNRCRSRDALCMADILYSQQKREDRCIFAQKILDTLHSSQFFDGMMRIYYADHQCNPPESFQSNVLTYKDFEVVCLAIELTTVLCHGDAIIPNSEDSSQCCTLSSDEKIIFISPHHKQFDEKDLLKHLSSQINLALARAIKNEKNIATLFECDPEHISMHLTGNRIPEHSMTAQTNSGGFHQLGTSLSLSTLSPQNAVIMVNFMKNEKVVYYSPTGELLLAQIMKTRSSLEGRKITNPFIEITTGQNESDDEDSQVQSILVSPLELFKILTEPQIKSLQENKPSFLASPLVMAPIPCDSLAEVKQWCKEIYCSEDMLMYSGLLVSLLKIRLVAHLHHHLFIGKITPEMFKIAVFDVLHYSATQQLPFTPICNAYDSKLNGKLDQLSQTMNDLSLADDDNDNHSDVSDDLDSNPEHEKVNTSTSSRRSATSSSHKKVNTSTSSGHSAASSSHRKLNTSTSSGHSAASSSHKKVNTSTSSGHSATRPVHEKVNISTSSECSQSPSRPTNCFARYQLKDSGHSQSPTRTSPFTHGAASSHSGTASPKAQSTQSTTTKVIATAYSRFKQTKGSPNQKMQTRFKPKKEPVKKPPFSEERARAWLEQAKVDYKAAQELLHISESDEDPSQCHFPALVCFLCHDIVEKCLKGLLYVYVENISTSVLNCSNLVTVMQHFENQSKKAEHLHDVCKEAAMTVSIYENKSRYPSFHNPPCAPAAVYLYADAKEAFGAVSSFMRKLQNYQLLSDIMGDLGIVPRPRFISSLKSSSTGCK